MLKSNPPVQLFYMLCKQVICVNTPCRKVVFEGVNATNGHACVKAAYYNNIIVTLSVMHLWQAI
jgi:hypothetical protein